MIRFACLLVVGSLVGSPALSAQNATAPTSEAPKPTPTPAPTSVTPAPTPTAPLLTARSLVLELAGAFANDGYKIRDGHWNGKLTPGKPQLIEVNLFAGNEYWISAAGLPPAEKIVMKVFDEAGRAVEMQTYEDGSKCAVGIEPKVSGKYFVQIQLAKGDAADFCLIYSYK